VSGPGCSSWIVDLDESHLPALVRELSGGDGTARAAASVMAQSMIDEALWVWLDLHGESWVRDRLPLAHMREENILTVLGGITKGSHRMESIVRAGVIPLLEHLCIQPTEAGTQISALLEQQLRIVYRGEVDP
jgi:hypothetical protein